MRINVYAEELTDEVELVVKHVDDAEFGPRDFYGLRMYLKSPPELHHGPDDDDRSAITFWIKWTRADGTDPSVLRAALNGIQDLVQEVIVRTSS